MSDRAITPRGINHLVLNVRDLEVSHKFWTEIFGFRQVAELKNRPFKMRFYSGLSEDGDVSHHDLAWPRRRRRPPGRTRGRCSPGASASTTWPSRGRIASRGSGSWSSSRSAG